MFGATKDNKLHSKTYSKFSSQATINIINLYFFGEFFSILSIIKSKLKFVVATLEFNSNVIFTHKHIIFLLRSKVTKNGIRRQNAL